MGSWTKDTPPTWAKNAIATELGWVDPDTNEILVCIKGLDVGKKPDSEKVEEKEPVTKKDPPKKKAATKKAATKKAATKKAATKKKPATSDK